MSNVDELFQRSNIAMFSLSNAITIAGNGKFHDASFLATALLYDSYVILSLCPMCLSHFLLLFILFIVTQMEYLLRQV